VTLPICLFLLPQHIQELLTSRVISAVTASFFTLLAGSMRKSRKGPAALCDGSVMLCSPALACPATPTKRPGRSNNLTQAQIEDLVAYICMLTRNLPLLFQQLAENFDFGVGKKAIRAALLKEGFHWRLTMKKPPISQRNQEIHLQ